jgi:predicted RNase H-like HicB family nuclease
MNRFSYNIKLDKHTFKVIIERDEDKWHAYCPILEDKGASTWGETWEEALKNIKEVLAMTLASMKQRRL